MNALMVSIEIYNLLLKERVQYRADLLGIDEIGSPSCSSHINVLRELNVV